MTFIDWLTEITKPLHQDAYNAALHFSDEWKQATQDYLNCNTDLQSANIKLVATQKQIQDLQAQIVPPSPIDTYLTKTYARIPNIAYTSKRISSIQTLNKTYTGGYNVYLNEFITPDAWEIADFKQKAIGATVDPYLQIDAIGRALKAKVSWVDETALYRSGDEYLYPSEVLTFMSQCCDCEDQSNTLTSCNPDVSFTGYFIYHNPDDHKDYGHCANVFLYNGQLFIRETTMAQYAIIPFPDPRYELHYAVTKDYTYQIDGSVQFGQTARWTL
jgi:hypothetical protein